MKKSFFYCAIATLALTSCVVQEPLYLETFSPEESGLNLVKITDEANNSVVAGTSWPTYSVDYSNDNYGYSRSASFAWSPLRKLALSPDGKSIAYITRMNNQDNIMVRSTSAIGLATQRTFRDVYSLSWGSNDKLYFSDRVFRSKNGYYNIYDYYICSVNASAGSMMNQHTNGSVSDSEPTLAQDGKTLYFVRTGSGGASVWTLNLDNGTLTSCARGYNPCLIPNDPDAFYCIRNSTNGRSELWYVNYVKGQESIILSDDKRSFTNPCLSPDGKWILLVGNSISSISQKNNLDIFVVRTDGSQLTQLTYHPVNDSSPVWAADGRSIYFISSRANEKQSYNIWRMNFNIE